MADGEESAIGDYLADLALRRKQEFARLTKLFALMAEKGYISNPEHLKDVAGHKPLYEFKAHGPRVYCLLHENRVVLLEGDIKTSDKSRSRNMRSIERAERKAALYLEAAKKGSITIR